MGNKDRVAGQREDLDRMLELAKLENEKLDKELRSQLATLEESQRKEIYNIKALHAEKIRKLRMQARAVYEYDIAESFRRSEEVNTAYSMEYKSELLNAITTLSASLSN